MPLEVQLQSKLKLPWVEGGGGPAVIAAVAGALVERADVVDEWRRSGFVEAVEEVEPFRNQLQPDLLAKWNQPRQTQIKRHVTMRQTKITPQASACKHSVRNNRRAEGSSAGDDSAGHAERSVSQHHRTIRLV